MSSLFSSARLLLSLLSGVPVVAQPSSARWEPSGVRRIELRADASEEVPEIPVRPDRTLTLTFDTALLQGSLMLEGREQFWRVLMGEDVLTLVPSDELRPGARFRMTVRFADGALPATAEFLLVVHPAPTEQQVAVYRQSRSAESYRQEAREAWEAAERCEAELERVREAQSGPDGLTGMLEAGLMDAAGVIAEALLPGAAFTQRPGVTLKITQMMAYRARGRMALELEVRNLGGEPWTAAGAELVGEGGVRATVLRVWSPGPRAPDSSFRRVVVEVELPEEPLGPSSLTLWDAEGLRSLQLRFEAR